MKLLQRAKKTLKRIMAEKPLAKSVITLALSFLLLGVTTFAWFTLANPGTGSYNTGVIDKLGSGFNVNIYIDNVEMADDAVDIPLADAIPDKTYKVEIVIKNYSGIDTAVYRVMTSGAKGYLSKYNELTGEYELDTTPSDDVLEFFSVSKLYINPQGDPDTIEGYRTVKDLTQSQSGIIGYTTQQEIGLDEFSIVFYIHVAKDDPKGLDINRFQGAYLLINSITISIKEQ